MAADGIFQSVFIGVGCRIGLRLDSSIADSVGNLLRWVGLQVKGRNQGAPHFHKTSGTKPGQSRKLNARILALFVQILPFHGKLRRFCCRPARSAQKL